MVHSKYYVTVWLYCFVFTLLMAKLSSTEYCGWYNILRIFIQKKGVLHCITWEIIHLSHAVTDQRNSGFSPWKLHLESHKTT